MNNDHDILIEVKTLLGGVIDDFRSYRKSSHEEQVALSIRLGAMEGNKVSVAEFVEHKKDEDARISRVEKWQWMMMGAIVVMQFIAPFIVNKIFP